MLISLESTNLHKQLHISIRIMSLPRFFNPEGLVSLFSLEMQLISLPTNSTKLTCSLAMGLQLNIRKAVL